MTPSHVDSTRVAAIDCGTNSIRLLVADRPASVGSTVDLVDVLRRMEIVRLGQDVDRTGRLAPEAIERTRVALAGYAAQIAALGAHRVRMVATSATRDATNAAEFQDMVRATLAVAPEVITGQQEAELSFAGAVRGLTATAPYLVCDIGGGSTEFVLGGTGVLAARSVDVGCVRMTERHLRSDPPGPAQIAAARADIESTVDGALRAVGADRAAPVVGVAGSVTTGAALALGLDRYQPDLIHHSRLSTVDVVRIADELLGMTRAQRLALPVMHPGRADVIGAGALILRVILERTGAAGLVVSEHDILDGIAWSLLT